MSKLDDMMKLWVRLMQIREEIKKTTNSADLEVLSKEVDDIQEELLFIEERNHNGDGICI